MSHFYGWSFQDCLKLPVKAFFQFHKQGVEMEIRNYRELLDISITPKMTMDYYHAMRARYNAIIDPKVAEMPPPPPGPILKGEERKAVVMSLFSALRRSQYGR